MNVDQVTEVEEDSDERNVGGDIDDYGLSNDQGDGEEAIDEYYDEYDEDLQADVDRLYGDQDEDNEGDQEDDADEPHMSIRVDNVYSEVDLGDELFDVEEVEEDYNDGEGEAEEMYEEEEEDDLAEGEGNLVIAETEENVLNVPQNEGKTSPSSFISAEFSNKLKTLRETIEYDRVVLSGNSSRENSRSSGSNETMQSALRYLQQLAKKQCMLEDTTSVIDPNDPSKLKCASNLNQNEENVDANGVEFKKPDIKSMPKLVTTFSDQLQQHCEKEMRKENQLPSYVQEMIDKDESLKRLLKTGSVTISQVTDSSPPSSPSSSNSSQQVTPRFVTCTPVITNAKNGTKGNQLGPVIISPVPNNGVSSNAVFEPNTDWSQFPSAHKLIEMAALAAESTKQEEIKLSVGKHFSALPGGSVNTSKAGKSLVPDGSTSVNRTTARSLVPGGRITPLAKRTPASIGTSSKLFNHIKAPEPKPSTSAAAAGFSLIGPASKSVSIPSSATSYLQQLANANKLKNKESESLFSTTKSVLQNDGGSILNTKLPLKRIISAMLDKEIDDQVPTSSKSFRMCSKTLDDDPPEEFDPMRFLEVSLQEGIDEDEEEDDDEFEVYSTEPGILPPRTGTGAKREMLPDDEARRKYICPHCLKGFCWSTDLKRHILTHTGERPFACPHCDASFTRKFLMQKHVKKYHGPGASTEHSTTGLVRTAPNSLLKSNQSSGSVGNRLHGQQVNGKLSNHRNQSGAKVLNGSRIRLNGNKNGFIDHTSTMRNSQSSSPTTTTNQQYYKYDPTQNINNILKSGHSKVNSRRGSTNNSTNQIYIKQNHMQPHYDLEQNEDYDDEESMIYDQEDVDMDMDYGLSTWSNNSSNDAEEDEDDASFPFKPSNPIVINISSRNGNNGGGSSGSTPVNKTNNYSNLKIEPRRINQSLVKQLIRANAQIKIAASTGVSPTPSSSSSKSLLNGNGNGSVTNKDSNVMPPPSFAPSSTIPRLKR